MSEPQSEVTGARRLSQPLAEGDGISVIVRVGDLDAARAAEEQGAEALVVEWAVAGIREATALPVLWSGVGEPAEAAAGGADAWRLAVRTIGDSERLEEAVSSASQLGLESVVDVCDEDELRVALERLDPEIVLLTGREAEDEEALDHVLSLLPDVPAGKLAIAELDVRGREDVIALERAGVDGVIVASGNIRALVGNTPPDV